MATDTPDPPPLPRTMDFDDEGAFHRYENGVHVLVAPDRYTKLVRVDLRIDAGSKEDPPGKAGLAHLAEHLIYELPVREGSDLTLAEHMARSSLQTNAYTTWDHTTFLASTNSKGLVPMLELASDWVNLDCAGLDEDTFLREREVVRNEVRARRGNLAAEYWDAIHQTLYPEDHPYHRYVGGDDGSLADIELQDVCTFFEEHYTTDALTVVIAGDVNTQYAENVSRRILMSLPATDGAHRRHVPWVATHEAEHELEIPARHPGVAVAFALPSRWSRKHIAARLATIMAPSTVGSVAADNEDILLAEARIIGGDPAPILVARAQVDPKGRDPQALEAILDDTARLLKEAVENAWRWPHDMADLYDAVRGSFRLDVLRSVSSMETRSLTLADYVEVFDNYGFYGTDVGIANDMTRTQYGSFVSALFQPDRAVVIKTYPDDSRPLLAARRAEFEYSPTSHVRQNLRSDSAAREAHRPLEVDTAFDSRAQVRALELENGMRVVLIQSSTFPVVSVRFLIDLDNTVREGNGPWLAELAALFLELDESTGNPFRIKNAYRLGTQLQPQRMGDFTEFRVDAFSNYADHLLEGLAELLIHGGYERKSLEQWREDIDDELARAEFVAPLRAQNVVYEAMYGRDHPYTLRAVSNIDTIDEVTAAKLRRFKRRHYRPDHVTLIVTGDVPLKLLEAHIRKDYEARDLSKALAGWRPSRDRPKRRPIPAIEVGQPRHFARVDERAVQTTVFIGFPMREPFRNDAARELLSRVMNDGLGTVRDTLGASYGIRTTTSVDPPFLAVAGTMDSKRAGTAMERIQTTLTDLRQGRGFESSFVFHRRAAVEGLFQMVSDPQRLADRYSFLTVHGLDSDYFQGLASRLGQTTIEDVYAEAKALLAPNRAVFLLEGPKPGIEAAYEAMGIDDISYLD